MKKFATFKTRAAAERLVKALREKLTGFGFEAVLVSGEWMVKVFGARGEFLRYAAPVPAALM